jgi:hypothetical protein
VSELTSLKRRVRHRSWLLQSVRIRQTARKAFDLTTFGNGALERLCSALILGAAFFFATLLLCNLAKLSPAYVIGISGLGFSSVMVASAVLVLWQTDAQLEEEGPRLGKELTELRVAVLEAKAHHDAELAQRAEEPAVEESQQPEKDATRPRPTTKRCPYCREAIRLNTRKCKHCGEILDEDLRDERRLRPAQHWNHGAVARQHWNPGVAAVLSFFWPGLGQMYKGQILNAFAWMFLVVLGYLMCIFPGFFLHVFCIFGAASGSEY